MSTVIMWTEVITMALLVIQKMVEDARNGASRSQIIMTGEVLETTTIVGIQMGSPDLGATELPDLKDGAIAISDHVIAVTTVFKKKTRSLAELQLKIY